MLHRFSCRVASGLHHCKLMSSGFSKLCRTNIRNDLHVRSLSTVPSSSAGNPLSNKVSNHRLHHLEVEFLGTGSFSTRFRFSSSVFLNLDKGNTWLFDAPDGTVRQSNLVTQRNFCHVRKIFISSMMSDTFTGLPNLIVSRLMSAPDQILSDKVSIEVYGPPGISAFLQYTLPLAMKTHNLNLLSLLTVYEMSLEQDHLQQLNESHKYQYPWVKEYLEQYQYSSNSSSPTNHNHPQSLAPPLFQTVSIPVNPQTGYWTLVDKYRYTLVAGLVGSPQPSFGFVFQETDFYGKLSPQILQEISRKYILPREVLGDVKRGGQATVVHRDNLQESTVLTPENLQLEKKKGRKIAIVNAGSDASTLSTAAMDCDLLIHPVSMNNLREDEARLRGISTPHLCVQAATMMQARRLIATRLSSHNAEEILETFSLWTTRSNRVASHLCFAKDGMSVKLPVGGYRKDDLHEGMDIEFPILSQQLSQYGNYTHHTYHLPSSSSGNLLQQNSNQAIQQVGHHLMNLIAQHTLQQPQQQQKQSSTGGETASHKHSHKKPNKPPHLRNKKPPTSSGSTKTAPADTAAAATKKPSSSD